MHFQSGKLTLNEINIWKAHAKRLEINIPIWKAHAKSIKYQSDQQNNGQKDGDPPLLQGTEIKFQMELINFHLGKLTLNCFLPRTCQNFIGFSVKIKFYAFSVKFPDIYFWDIKY